MSRDPVKGSGFFSALFREHDRKGRHDEVFFQGYPFGGIGEADDDAPEFHASRRRADDSLPVPIPSRGCGLQELYGISQKTCRPAGMSLAGRAGGSRHGHIRCSGIRILQALDGRAARRSDSKGALRKDLLTKVK